MFALSVIMSGVSAVLICLLVLWFVVILIVVVAMITMAAVITNGITIIVIP